MIGLYVCIGRQRSKRIEIAKERVTIGSDASNDLVLRDGGVEPFHGALLRLRDRWFLSSREANARSSNRMHALEDGARLQIGEYTLVLAAAAPRDPIAPVAPAAPAPRDPIAPAAPAEAHPAAPRPARLPVGTPPASMPVATPASTRELHDPDETPLTRAPRAKGARSRLTVA